MKRGTFRQKTYEEKLAQIAAKRHKIAQVKKKSKNVTKPRVKLKTQAQLKKELDKVFSLYIRHKYPKVCYTCGKTDIALQCGHFVSRQYLATRWDENNCRPQCAGCNIFGNGKPLDFEENLKKEFGDQFIEKMKASRHQSLKLDRHWYEEQIAKYKLLITP
jgi:5-methylcytosine-specific restriction endonuclease McrA